MCTISMCCGPGGQAVLNPINESNDDGNAADTKKEWGGGSMGRGDYYTVTGYHGGIRTSHEKEDHFLLTKSHRHVQVPQFSNEKNHISI